MVRDRKNVGWAKPADAQASDAVPTIIAPAENGMVGTAQVRLCPPYGSGHSAFTIASSPSVSAAGPGCRISGDLISTMRLLCTAGISFQPGRCLILSGTTFLPHQDARITSGAASRTASGGMMRSFADC